MRGIFLILALLGSLVFSGCGQALSLPPVPITLDLKTSYKSLAAGPHPLMLRVSENGSLVLSSDIGVEFFSISKEALSVDTSFPTIDETLYEFQGTSGDDITIHGKVLSLAGVVWEKVNEGGHHSYHEVRNYHLKAELSRNGTVIGTVLGDAAKDVD